MSLKTRNFVPTIAKNPPSSFQAHSSFVDRKDREWFPRLHNDIVIPDIVYYSPPCADIAYFPPGNEDSVVLNAWLGPGGTVSSANQDPYFNCYAQVVGRKTVWLAPPEFKAEMYSLPSHSLDVFNPDKYPVLQPKVLKELMAVALQPGDLSCFPPRRWHAMRCKDKGFSISFWF
ncbi:hypothetical protein FRC20_004502 [Serendipita sp. 405]|nr:hypothetical protein FRC15_004771 [Serendipita sp. 397]KAG8777027.1 hypothetical protein FRC16_004328 [Serendipita sp. 398]KAG8842322.1 hypothetical protein FRC20_004502 [Serendipita sp. 405]